MLALAVWWSLAQNKVRAHHIGELAHVTMAIFVILTALKDAILMEGMGSLRLAHV